MNIHVLMLMVGLFNVPDGTQYQKFTRNDFQNYVSWNASTYEWERWASDLVDWIHYHQFVSPDTRTRGLFCGTPEVKSCVKKLVSIDRIELSNYGRDLFKKNHSTWLQFVQLLDQMHPPFIVFPGEKYSAVNQMTLQPENHLVHRGQKTPFDKSAFIHFHFERADRKVRADKLIRDWEAFAEHNPQQRLLAGYAALYACILRLRYKKEEAEILPFLRQVEMSYRDQIPVALMAKWYIVSFLVYKRDNQASQEIADFLSKYGKHDWWVVRACRELQEMSPRLALMKTSRKYGDRSVLNVIDMFYEPREKIWGVP